MLGTPHDPKAANVRNGKGSNAFLGFGPVHDGATCCGHHHTEENTRLMSLKYD